MGKKLSIVVTCTDGKTVTPEPAAMVRNLTSTQPAARRRQWADRLANATAKIALRHLYRGQLWSSSLRLESVARGAGYDVDLYVASAGLGLRHVDSLGVGYAATFSPRQDDSVADGTSGCQAWWEALKDLPGSLDLAQLTSPRLMLVASDVYASALHHDLVALGLRARTQRVVVFGGSTDLSGVHRVAANRDLRTEMGGSLTAINARSAARWIEMDRNSDFWSEQLERDWQQWAETVQVSETHHRNRLDDAEVKAFIREHLNAGGAMSRTSALRALRNSGRACEQRRFQELFGSVAVSE